MYTINQEIDLEVKYQDHKKPTMVHDSSSHMYIKISKAKYMYIKREILVYPAQHASFFTEGSAGYDNINYYRRTAGPYITYISQSRYLEEYTNEDQVWLQTDISV